MPSRKGAALAACLVVLSVAHLALAGWAAVDAASFTTVLADFGPLNPHLIHDFAACAATFGIGLAVAVRLPAWRTPALALAAVWNGLHDVSHVVDVDRAASPFVGVAEVIGLTVITLVLAGLAVLAHRQARRAAVGLTVSGSTLS